jgi:uncharacterized membrane protein
MAAKTFSKKEAISYGWNATKKNFRFFILLMLSLFAINILPGILRSSLTPDKNSLIAFLISILSWILQLIVGLGLIKIALEIQDHKKTHYSELFSQSHMIINYFLASVLYGLIIVAGLILLIVPGIIWGIKFQYFSYFIVDKQLGPIEALKESSKITKGSIWNIFLLRVLLGLINIGGTLLLGVGLLVTVPITMMAEVHVFRKLTTKK